MIYRENGQFKSTYRSDLQMLPILQDRIFMILLAACAFVVVPLVASDYLFLSILIPFLILTLAAIGLNLLVGYCGQISIGHAAFMAVGAYAAYNIVLRVPGLNFLIVLILAGFIAAAAGMIFGIPSLRIKGLYLAVATLAAQFFSDWVFARVKWFTNYSHSGSVSVGPIDLFGWRIDTPTEKYVFLLGILIVFTIIAKNLVRGHIGRAWMATRDMDVAAEVIGIRPIYAKLTAFGVSAFYGAAFIVVLPILLNQFPQWLGIPISTAMASHLEFMIFGALIVVFLIVEPHGLARLWSIGKEKLRLWPFPH